MKITNTLLARNAGVVGDYYDTGKFDFLGFLTREDFLKQLFYNSLNRLFKDTDNPGSCIEEHARLNNISIDATVHYLLFREGYIILKEVE